MIYRWLALSDQEIVDARYTTIGEVESNFPFLSGAKQAWQDQLSTITNLSNNITTKTISDQNNINEHRDSETHEESLLDKE